MTAAILFQKMIFLSALNQDDIQQHTGNECCVWPESVDMFLLLSEPHMSLNSTLLGNKVDNSSFPNYIFLFYNKVQCVSAGNIWQFSWDTNVFSSSAQSYSTKHNAVLTADGCSTLYMIFVNSQNNLPAPLLHQTSWISSIKNDGLHLKNCSTLKKVYLSVLFYLYLYIYL